MAVSLVLSGALTGVLVEKLNLSNTQSSLAQRVTLVRSELLALECPTSAAGAAVCTSIDVTDFSSKLPVDLGLLSLGSDRVAVLGDAPSGDQQVVYDSGGSLYGNAPTDLPAMTEADPVAVGTTHLNSVPYLYSEMFLTRVYQLNSRGARVPESLFLILARPQGDVTAQARSQLVPPILEAGGLALLVAVVIATFFSRALSRSLTELESGAEDIAAGNYSRRVAVKGGMEVAVVGQAFNRMAEAVERSREGQRRFLADVSHELKTPLTSLIGFSQALVDGSLIDDAARQRAATILHEEAQRVLRMSQELLDLARVESGQLPIRPEPVDLVSQLGQEVEIVKSRAQTRGLSFEFVVNSPLPPGQADPERLHQILENLLDNAVKYASEDSTISITAKVVDRAIQTEIRNRVGSHPPAPDRMFDRFYRADPSRSSAAGGVGLGLAISRELALAQGGDLGARLELGDVLVMTLGLPVAPSESEPGSELSSTVRLARDRPRLRPGTTPEATIPVPPGDTAAIPPIP